MERARAASNEPQLSPDIVALIHESELNRAGWIEEHKASVLRSLFWIEGTLSANQVCDRQASVGLSGMTVPEVQANISVMVSNGTLVETEPTAYRLSENARREVASAIDDAEELQRTVTASFTQLLDGEFGPERDREINDLWGTFHERFLVRLVEYYGARTYEILTGDNTDIDYTAFATDFVSEFDERYQAGLVRIIQKFLDPGVVEFREYTLRLLNSHFFKVSFGHRKESLEAMYSNRRPTIRCMVDTNFLYSILELHENPSNEAAKALLNTIEKARNYIDVRLYVFPPTIDELKRSLSYHEEILSRIRLTPTIYEATTSTRVASGVVQRFFEMSARSGFTLNAKDYFDPYHHNLVRILGEKGIRIFNEKTDKYSTDQRVIDDALEQYHFVRRRRWGTGRRQPKSYEQIWHDMLLWYFIFDKRPAYVESVVDVGMLGVTIDYSLIGFDAFKRNKLDSGIPLFVHPATLTQVFRFFVPMDEAIGAAIVDTLRLPMLLREFDAGTEKTTLRILARLSRFQRVDDLSSNVVRRVLEDEILREKLDLVDDEDKEIQLVRDALIEEHASTQAELDAARKREKDLLHRVAEIGGMNDEARQAVARFGSELVKEREELAQERKEKADLSELVEVIRTRLDDVERERDESEERRGFVTRAVLFPLGGVLVSIWVAERWLSAQAGLVWLAPVCLVVLLVWGATVVHVGRKSDHVRSWTWFRRFVRFRRLLGGAGLTLVLGILGRVYWETVVEYVETLG